jgi:outer membrane protein assembly factor BamE (lipoprotein component of BamABCDE complex)
MNTDPMNTDPEHVNGRTFVNKSRLEFFGRMASPLAALFLAGAVTGCSGVSDTRGNFPLAEVVDQIKPDQHTRREILSMLGSPSTRATFEKQEVWYYIGEKTETLAFFTPKVLERKILVIQFDKKGVVKDIRKLDASNGKHISLVERITPTKGKELTVLQQILGNVGRFGKPKNEEQ